MPISISWNTREYLVAVESAVHSEEHYQRALDDIVDMAKALYHQHTAVAVTCHHELHGGLGLRLTAEGPTHQCGQYMARLHFLVEDYLSANSFMLEGATKHPVVALLSSRRWVAQPLLREMEDAVRQQERIDDEHRLPNQP
jgi:hypothetical protein